MSTLLFCFSATGNSLTTARLLAKELPDCTVIPVPSLRNREEISVRADAVGFIYPIYYSDMPALLRSVIRRMDFENHPYIFSVCTCRGHFGNVAQRLDALLRERGQHLHCSLSVRLPGNSRISTPEQNAEMLAAQADAVHAVAQTLLTYPEENHFVSPAPEPSPVDKPCNMRSMESEDHCIGCGICASVCPMDNIRIENGRALMGDNCLSCMACFHWCPEKAIWMHTAEEDIRRRFQYRHPDVTLQDMLSMK